MTSLWRVGRGSVALKRTGAIKFNAILYFQCIYVGLAGMNIINEMDFIFDSFDVSGLASPVLFLHFILLCKSTFK